MSGWDWLAVVLWWVSIIGVVVAMFDKPALSLLLVPLLYLMFRNPGDRP